jgi:uncharacterized phiE125 gp8 family phage protein
VQLDLVTPPAAEPVSLAQAKLHLRIGDYSDEDALISTWITAARERVEAEVSRALVTQSYDMFLDSFPYGGGYMLREVRQQGWITHANPFPRSLAIKVPRPPLVSVDTIEYTDQGGQLVTLDPSQYRVRTSRSRPGTIEPAYGVAWPIPQPVCSAVRIRFTAGYGNAAAVPASAVAAMLLIIGHRWLNRESVITGTIASELPQGVSDVLAPLKWGRYS